MRVSLWLRLIFTVGGLGFGFWFLKHAPELSPAKIRAGILLLGVFCLIEARLDWPRGDDLNPWQSVLLDLNAIRKARLLLCGLLGVGLVLWACFYPT